MLRAPVTAVNLPQMAKKPANTADDPEQEELDFESALADLEALVQSMEAGDLSLEESLKAFERGVKLTRHCQEALKSAELKVKMLTENDEIVNFDPDSAE